MKPRTFRGKNIVVTGAASGLGRALCLRLARDGARLGAIDRQDDALATLADELRAAGSEVTTATVDIRHEGDVLAAMDTLRNELGPIDGLINNAGITHIKNFRRGESASVQRVMEVNFLGSVHCTAAVLDDLIERGGVLITISSIAGFAPLIGRSGYSASKHALHGFFNTLRLELRHTNVDVLLVCPSFIRTNIRQAFDDEGGSVRDGKPGTDGRQRALRPGASPESIADLIVNAARRRKRQITTGVLGHLSYWATRILPRFYEAMMVRRMRDEE